MVSKAMDVVPFTFLVCQSRGVLCFHWCASAIINHDFFAFALLMSKLRIYLAECDSAEGGLNAAGERPMSFSGVDESEPFGSTEPSTTYFG